jgi:hypothetical protein
MRQNPSLPPSAPPPISCFESLRQPMPQMFRLMYSPHAPQREKTWRSRGTVPEALTEKRKWSDVGRLAVCLQMLRPFVAAAPRWAGRHVSQIHTTPAEYLPARRFEREGEKLGVGRSYVPQVEVEKQYEMNCKKILFCLYMLGTTLSALNFQLFVRHCRERRAIITRREIRSK